MDSTLYQIYRNELETYLTKLQSWIDTSNATLEISSELKRTLHTIYGSSKSANVEQIGAIANLLENYTTLLQVHNKPLEKEGIEYLRQAVIMFYQVLEDLQLNNELNVLGFEELEQELQDAIQKLQSNTQQENEKANFKKAPAIEDPELFSLFLEEARDLLDLFKDNIDLLEQDIDNISLLGVLKKDLHSLKGGARIAGLNPFADLCQALEHLVEAMSEIDSNKRSEYLLLLQDSYQRLNGFISALYEQETVVDDNVFMTADLVSIINSYTQIHNKKSSEIEDYAPLDLHEINNTLVGSSPDPELISLFVEEARDLLDSSEPALNTWINNTKDKAPLAELQHFLHTLKGGARMAGLSLIGDLSHALEKFINKLSKLEDNAEAGAKDIIKLLQDGFDGLYESIERVRKDLPLDTDEELLNLKDTLEQYTFESQLIEEQIENKTTKMDKVLQDVKQQINPKVLENAKCDPELLMMFLKEAQDILANAKIARKTWQENLNNLEVVIELQRYLHTLKGGARMSYLEKIGDFSHALEDVLSHVTHQALPTDEILFHFIEACFGLLEDLTHVIITGESDDKQQAEYKELMAVAQDYIERGKQADVEIDISDYDPELINMFLEEADDLLNEADEALGKWFADFENLEHVLELQRHLHTLKGGARMSGLKLLGDFSHAIESFLTQSTDGVVDFSIDSQAQGLLRKAFDKMYDMVETVKKGGKLSKTNEIKSVLHQLEHYTQAQDIDLLPPDVPSLDELEKEFNIENDMLDLGGDDLDLTDFDIDTEIDLASLDLDAELESPIAEEIPSIVEETYEFTEDIPNDPETLEMFLEESQDLLASCEASFEKWKQDPKHLDSVLELQRHLHTLKGGARMCDLMIIGNFTHALETMLLNFTEKDRKVDDHAFVLVQQSFDLIYNMVDAVKNTNRLASDKTILDAQKQLEHYPESVAIATPSVVQKEEKIATPVIEADLELPPPDEPQEMELVEIFVEEGRELLTEIETALEKWKENNEDEAVVQEIQRHLHTLKGGARMSSFMIIGNFSHALETMLLNFSEKGRKVDEDAFKLVQQSLDILNNMVDMAQNQRRLEIDMDTLVLQHKLERYPEADKPTAKKVDKKPKEKQVKSKDNVVPLPSLKESKEEEKAVSQPKPPKTEKSSKSASSDTDARALEPIKVRGEVLDNLVNFAGEINIYHARIGQQITTFRFNLQELDRTAARLREQLRRMEIETETQIMFRYEKEGDVEEFDPLEMDRFTNMQQMSRSLTETVGDLLQIKNLMTETVRVTETLLIQQNRISTDLQDGLMRTRMVKFEEKISRFRRVLRQTCDFLGKKAELKVDGAQNELDRNLLERLVGPMEHILRNSVSHGIEEPAKRKANGKPEVGTVKIDIFREGGEIVVKVADDGAGINTKKVFEKAVSNGMVAKDARLTEKQIMYLLLESGFSTAEEVSQISGRGVGMDVVNSEVKQMGGTLEIDSILGQGASFTVRLPFTLAINQSLIVQIDDYDYAIPIVNVEGIVRIPNHDLNNYYEKRASYTYAGNDYDLRYLGTLLGLGKPKLETDSVVMKPVLMTRSGDIRVALQVDLVKGIQEVVVKNVGPQLSQVSGIAGATILGDGRVILILEVNSLIRKVAQIDISTLEKQAEQDKATRVVEEERKPLVMVVDDSITIRRVTERFLKRNDMDAITAKDGMDAVALLQEVTPDAMLLDIEMPRMDGFELATHIRNQDHLKSVPIIMISSRSGEKHRVRAKEIGVNRFLSKPYQENQLLENIKELLEEVKQA